MRPARVLLPSGQVVAPEDLEDGARVRPPPAVPKARSVVGQALPWTGNRQATATAPPRSDRELLEALEGQALSLDAREREAFAGMLERMRDGRTQFLTYPQRAWAQQSAARLGLDVAAPGDWQETAKETRRRA